MRISDWSSDVCSSDLLPPLPDEKFGVISIDIPWHFRSRAPTQNHPISRSPQRHYPTMDLEHAEQLPIKHLANPAAHVFMCITGRSAEPTSALRSLMRISYAVSSLQKKTSPHHK